MRVALQQALIYKGLVAKKTYNLSEILNYNKSGNKYQRRAKFYRLFDKGKLAWKIQPRTSSPDLMLGIVYELLCPCL